MALIDMPLVEEQEGFALLQLVDISPGPLFGLC